MAYLGSMAYRYRGDPGLWGALKGAVKGFVTGGPLGAITGGISGAVGRPSAPAPRQIAAMPTAPLRPVPGLRGAGQRLVPGGATGYTMDVPPAGFHLNKSDYFLKDGTFVPKGSRYVKNRTRNFANGRALRRSITRAKGFERLVKRNRAALRSLARI